MYKVLIKTPSGYGVVYKFDSIKNAMTKFNSIINNAMRKVDGQSDPAEAVKRARDIVAIQYPTQ